MDALKLKSFNEAIIFTKILDNGELLVVDSESTVRYLDTDTLELLSGFKIKIKYERHKSSLITFSHDGNYFALISQDLRESRLYNTQSKKVISKMSRHHGEVSCVGIDPKSRYMFSCGDDGKTFAVDIKSGKIAFTLPIHIDTVNDIAFSENGQWLVTASYDRKVSLFNLDMMTPKYQIKSHSAPVMKVKFLSNNRVLSIDKDAKAVVTDIYTTKVLARLEGVHDDVTQITQSGDGKFLFLGTDLGYVIVYELDGYKLLSRDYIKISSSITSLTFNAQSEHLIVGSEDGDLYLYDIYTGVNNIKQFLKDKEYGKIKEQIKENPILEYTNINSMLETLWEKTLSKAQYYLEMGENKRAIQIFQPFKNIPSKNQQMQKMILEYTDFSKFSTLVKQEKYPLAYSLANTFKLYKDSKLYHAMELKWKKVFTQARKYALDPRGAEKAREILKPFRGVSEKTKFIQDLLTQGEVYKRFRSSMAQKEFKISFELLRQHPFLKEFPEYETLMNYADTLYIKSNEFIKEGDTHAALKMLRILVDFSDFETEAKELMESIEISQKFFNAIEDEDITLAYNLLAESPILGETEDGKRLHELWNSDLQIANNCAVDADIACIKNSLKEYMNISSKYMSLGTVFGWAYMIQLENSIKQKREQHEVEEGIKNYILCFGIQDQIESFFHIFKKYYPKSKLNLELLTKGSLEMWRPSMIVNSILEA